MRVSFLATLLPVVLLIASPAHAREWYAGDGHVHTCYSHDAWCPEESPQPEALYSNFGSVQQRFVEARAKGLDFLVISDHDDIRAWSDPAFGSQGVIGIRAYEASLEGGHAHAIGVTRHHDEGDGGPTAVQTLATSVTGEGGLFQANHPGYRASAPVSTCGDVATSTEMHWRYGFTIQPSLIEVWNPTTIMQPGELLWECWLQRGVRMPAGAGSDSHGGLTAQIGNPTLWVLAEAPTEAAIVDAMRAGRTTITRRAPSQGAARLLLEGPGGAVIGDTVAPGSKLTARVDGLDAPGFVRIRANGRTLLEAPIAPGGRVEFTAPAEPGWVRATLLMTEAAFAGHDMVCTPNEHNAESPVSLCPDDLLVAALTSPVYVAEPVAGKPRKKPKKPRKPKHRRHSHGSEPDSEPPLPPVLHSSGGTDLPRVPRARL